MPAKKDKKSTEKKGSKQKSPLKPTSPTQYTEKEFPFLGIGASAGGLKALEKSFDNMPSQVNHE